MITILLQLDYDLFSLFVSSIHMEIALVSFERCVNMSRNPINKIKDQYQQEQLFEEREKGYS